MATTITGWTTSTTKVLHTFIVQADGVTVRSKCGHVQTTRNKIRQDGRGKKPCSKASGCGK